MFFSVIKKKKKLKACDIERKSTSFYAFANP